MNDTKPLQTFYGVYTSAEEFGQVAKREVRAKTYFYRFESKEAAELAFYEAYVKAYQKFKDVKQSLKGFEDEHGVRIDYFLDGDTHGLRSDLTITFTIDNFEFEMQMNGVHPIYDLDPEIDEECADDEDDDLESDAPRP